MVFSGLSGDHVLFANSPQEWSLENIGRLQADLRIDSESGSNASSKIQIVTTLPDGKGEWWAQCNVYSGDGKTAEINCDFYRWGANNILNYATSGFHAELGKFYTVAIEITPDASNVRYYLNGNKIGDYQPAEKSLLAKANFRWHIGLYVDSGGTATGAVDNVMVGPASLPVTLTPTEITSVNSPFAVTNVTYSTSVFSEGTYVDCALVTAHITANGEGDVIYRWTRSDGASAQSQTIHFDPLGIKMFKKNGI